MKLGDEYKLYSHDSCIATTQESPHKRLSKQNCDEIFGVVDVVDVIYKQAKNGFDGIINPFTEAFAKACIDKSMELNKDKLFTVEDVKKIVEMSRDIKYVTFSIDELISSLQQPKEIEVEIEMEKEVGTKLHDDGREFFWTDGIKPKLDADGCLILKIK